MLAIERLEPKKHTVYVCLIVFSLCFMLAVKATTFGVGHSLTDFDIVYLVAQMTLNGDIASVYSDEAMHQIQAAHFGETVYQPWPYPPQFCLVLAPMAFLPMWVAYLVYMAAALALYLVTLRKLAGEQFAFVLLLQFPAIIVNMASGQNGLLVAGLVGLTCLEFMTKRPSAGIPMGLIIIKPHFGLALTVYALASQRWVVVAVAATTMLATCVATTIAFGWNIWADFVSGIVSMFFSLGDGNYPLFRMASAFAAARSFGLPSWVSILCQLLVSIGSIWVICLAIARKFTTRETLGLVAIATLLVSPYCWDYDTPILGVGLALLLPVLINNTGRIRFWIYALAVFAGAYSCVLQIRLSHIYKSDLAAMISDPLAISLTGLALVALFLICWIALNSKRCRLRSIAH